MVRPLVWEQVNSVTWKLTDGRHIDTPRSHGNWPGFRTSLAVGWIMHVNADWFGRVTIRGKRMSSGPATFDAAKRWVKNRVRHLPIAKPQLHSVNRMAFDGGRPSSRPRVEHDLWQTILECETGLPAPAPGMMTELDRRAPDLKSLFVAVPTAAPVNSICGNHANDNKNSESDEEAA